MWKKSEILQDQRAWASKEALVHDEKGYLPNYQDNLFHPMNERTKAAFDQGSGSELKDSPRSPAKMRALHSSSALAVNFFDPWVERENGDLLEALGVQVSGNCGIRFEAQYPTGLPGNPPNLDVALELSSGEVIGVESKFTEWFTPKPKGKAPFKDKYFPADTGLWSSVSLPECQALAEQMRDGDTSFRYLDAAQLLKHALGLASSLGNRFRLYYTYFDADCPEGEAHRSEIENFAAAVGGELKFQAVSYQKLIDRLEKAGSGREEYRSYLQSRYCIGVLPR